MTCPGCRCPTAKAANRDGAVSFCSLITSKSLTMSACRSPRRPAKWCSATGSEGNHHRHACPPLVVGDRMLSNTAILARRPLRRLPHGRGCGRTPATSRSGPRWNPRGRSRRRASRRRRCPMRAARRGRRQAAVDGAIGPWTVALLQRTVRPWRWRGAVAGGVFRRKGAPWPRQARPPRVPGAGYQLVVALGGRQIIVIVVAQHLSPAAFAHKGLPRRLQPSPNDLDWCPGCRPKSCCRRR